MGTFINKASPPAPAAEGFSPISVHRHTLRLWYTTRGSGSGKEKRVSAGKSQRAFQSGPSSPCHGSLSTTNKGTPGNGPRWGSVPLLFKSVAIQTELGGHWGSAGLVAMAPRCSKALCARLSSPRGRSSGTVTGLISCSTPAACGPTPDRTAGAHGMLPSRQPELVRGAPGSHPVATHVPPAGCHRASRLQGYVPAPTLPRMMLLTQLRFSCAPHPPAPPPFPGPLSPCQHHTAALGRGRKPHGELQCPPPNPTKSCSVRLQVPRAALVSTSKPHQKLQHQLPSPMRHRSIHLQSPQGARASTSMPQC